jgi:hypothetical protein
LLPLKPFDPHFPHILLIVDLVSEAIDLVIELTLAKLSILNRIVHLLLHLIYFVLGLLHLLIHIVHLFFEFFDNKEFFIDCTLLTIIGVKFRM